jgi:GNAT superfamily N-acetyltransferase
MVRFLEHDFAMRAAVADVVEQRAEASILGDGRAPGMPEWNHAALIRAGEGAADAALDRVEAFFAKRKRAAAIALDAGAAPADLPERLAARGFAPWSEPDDLMAWDPTSRHIYTAGEAYSTLATNATLDEWMRIATCEMRDDLAAQAKSMLALQYRAPGFTFWFGLFDGAPAAACPLFISNGIAQVGPLHVAPEFRGKGMGLSLLNFVTRQSRKDGAEQTYLFNPRNGPASGLCATTGYHIIQENARTFWVRR